MSRLNTEWAQAELDRFLELTELYRRPDPPGVTVFTLQLSNRGPQPEIVAQAQVVEQILDKVLPRWKSEVPDEGNKSVNRWVQHREAVQRAQVVLARQAEIRANLGDDAPELSAANMHPWVWDGARSLWSSGHFYEAVGAAARKVNAEVQNKLGRRDISEAALFQNAFSTSAPKPGEPRLRVVPDDGGKTFTSVHRGAINMAEGWYAAVRNRVAHEDADVAENVALEQLAALSLIARWADEATVEQ